MTSTCGLFVRSTQTRTGELPYPHSMLVLASVTDRLVDFATNVVGDLGIAGIFALMVPESACIPIPSEATMLFAGFNVSKGKFSLLAAVAAGVAANVSGSWIADPIGGFGPDGVLER